MTDAPIAKTATRFMREEVKAPLPPELDAAAVAAAESLPALRDVRRGALAGLRKRGLPHSGTEEFSFLRVTEFLPHLSSVVKPDAAPAPNADAVKALIFPECKDSYLVLLDGVYASALSHPGPGFQISLLEDNLDMASRAPLPELRAYLVKSAEQESDPGAALAIIFTAHPVLVQVAAKSKPPAPLQILHLHSPSRNPLPVRRDAWVVIRGGRLSESRVLVRHATLGAAADSAMDNTYAHLVVEEGASIKWLEAGGEAAHLGFRKLSARVDRDARLSATAASVGSKLTRNAFAVDLVAPGADVELSGATVLAETRQNHNHVTLRHLAANCGSRQHFKTVAADKAKSSVDGGIFVAEGAQQTNAYQLINNLMLSDEARADSKPRLMIHADDVKCSHGATVGKLDAAQQFYLESRGLTAGQARTLLTVAFIDEIVEKAATGAWGFHEYLERSMVDILRKASA